MWMHVQVGLCSFGPGYSLVRSLSLGSVLAYLSISIATRNLPLSATCRIAVPMLFPT